MTLRASSVLGTLSLCFLACRSQEIETLKVELAKCGSKAGSVQEELRRCQTERDAERERFRARLEQAIQELPSPDSRSLPPPPKPGTENPISLPIIQPSPPPPVELDSLLERYFGAVKLALQRLEGKSEATRVECQEARVAVTQGVQGTQEVAASVAKVNESVEAVRTQLEQCSQRLEATRSQREGMQALVRRLRDALAKFDQQRVVCEDCKGALDVKKWKQDVILDFHGQLDRDLKALETQLGQ